MTDYVLSLLSFFSISLILAMSCFVVLKSGEISFGQQAFFGVGAYMAGVLTALLDWPLWPAVAAAAVGAAAFALLAGLMLLKFTGFQFSLITLIIGEFAKEVFQKLRWIKQDGERVVGPDGPLGFSGIDYFYRHHIEPPMQAALLAGVAAACVLAVFCYFRSARGLAVIAAGEDDHLSASLGINPGRMRLEAFILGGGLAGIGGALFAHHATYIDAINFNLMMGVHAIAYTLIGGLGSALGPVLGTAIDIVLLESVRITGAYRMVTFGALLVLVLILRPQGLLRASPAKKGALA